MFLDNVKMKPKLLILFIITGIIPLAVVAMMGSHFASKALLDLAFQDLTTIQVIKRDKLQATLIERINDLRLLAGYRQTHQAMEELGQLVAGNGSGSLPVMSDEFRKVLGKFDRQFKDFIAANGFDDLYLIDRKNGMILYTAGQIQEAGGNVATGPLQNSGIARAWNSVLQSGNVAFEDFAPNTTEQNHHSAFIGCPVRDHAGNISGVMVVRVSGAFVSQLLPSRQGMGESGESYLVRWFETENRFELRSNIQTMGQGRYVIGYTLERPPVYWDIARQNGFHGGGGTFQDSAGTEVLVQFTTLDVLGTQWILVSKINRDEVIRPIRTFLLAISATGAALILLIAPGAFQLARRISNPLEQGVHFAESISAGDLQARLDLRQNDELGMLARALNRMARNLRDMDWLRQGQTGMDDTLRGEHTPRELAKLSISFLCRHMESQLGLFFLHDADELVLTASYAFTNRTGEFSRIQVGEGLVGQAALEGEILFFNKVETGTPSYHAGTEEINLPHFMAVPVQLDGVLLGAMLLGSEKPFSLLHRQLLEQVVDNLAIVLNMANSRNTISKLLQKAQEQQEMLRVANEELEEQTNMLKTSQAELQAQQEELQVTNEELAEQTRALKESESRLQEQQEELQFANDKLGERATELEEQKGAIRKKNKELLRAQEQLKLKAQELEIASRYKSEFLANMSHELRTPLNSILILSQLLANNKEANLTERQIESAQAINASGSDLLKLINEILDLSKVEAGRMELQLEDVPLDNLVSDLSRIFKGIAADKDVAFLIKRDPDLPTSIVTDNYRLQQILRNLLSNAFKFTDNGAVTLSIFQPQPESDDLLNSVSADQTICLSVHDQGIGIPLDKQATIFEAFKQADSGTSRKYGGTGLGLSISRELAKLLGGEIRMKSREGQGSTFTLIIPEIHAGQEMLEEEAHADTATVPAATPNVTPDAGPQSQPETELPACIQDDRKELAPGVKSVLIIEDDPNFAHILRDQAREMGFKALVACDGETGLHFADYYSPSAILLDIELPGIDGWEVMERLKNDPATRHIPVHFISAADSTIEAMRKGAIGYLTKPVDVESLQTAFSKIEAFVSKPLRRLLVVDDDPLQRESIRKLIGNGDVETTTCASGPEALELLEDQSFDCMILDLGLQGMSGFEVLRTLRANQHWNRIPVVVYTGRELSEEEEQRLRRYAESIIVKGVRSPERLLEETTLFLHRIQANLPPEQQRILHQYGAEKESALLDRTILVVDDDMRNVFALSHVLEENGMQVLVARDGRESLATLEKNPHIALVLMDIMMPNMDGYEAIQTIRQDHRFKKLPLIALTAKAMKGDRHKCIEAGANDYLSKPVDTDKLLSMLRVWLYEK